jgi:hypothetical protein
MRFRLMVLRSSFDMVGVDVGRGDDGPSSFPGVSLMANLQGGKSRVVTPSAREEVIAKSDRVA